MEVVYEKEFQYKVQNDGIILIRNDTIIKKKPVEKLTADLIYDDVGKVFLDADKNVYKFHATLPQILRLIHSSDK